MTAKPMILVRQPGSTWYTPADGFPKAKASERRKMIGLSGESIKCDGCGRSASKSYICSACAGDVFERLCGHCVEPSSVAPVLAFCQFHAHAEANGQDPFAIKGSLDAIAAEAYKRTGG